MPTRDSRVRTVVAYSIHGRDRNGVINYRAFLEQVTQLARDSPGRREISGQMVALSAALRQDNGTIALRFLAGNEFDVPIFFDTRTGEEQMVDSAGGVFVVGTWAIINPATRMVALERKRPGVGASLIERFLELSGRALGYEDLSIDLNPSSDEGFDEEVQRLDTIKKVAVTVKQPNFDWADDHNAIHDYAEASGAGSATVEMRAPRGEGLSPTRGIVRDVLGLARSRISSLRNVVVTGSEVGDAGDKSINLNRFQRKSSVRVDRGASPLEELDAILPAADALTREDEQDADS